MSEISERQAMPDAMNALINPLGFIAVSTERQFTLSEQAALTGISAANLLRFWKHDPDWNDVIFVVGRKDYRTTLARINRCRDRAAIRARKQIANRQ